MTATAQVTPGAALGRDIEVRGLAYAYAHAAAPAIDRVDLRVRAGELVCLLGPSGAGKTTLLRLVAGLLRPTSGEVVPGPGAARAAIGWMAQRDGLLAWRTVLANVALPLRLAGQSRETAEVAARLELARVGLSHAADHYPHQLSGGMRQRAALARALVHEPGMLLLDEPFAHLDELTREELGAQLERLWLERRPTVLMVTHSALEAVRLADRVVVLSPSPARVLGEVAPAALRPRGDADAGVLDAVFRAKELLHGA